MSMTATVPSPSESVSTFAIAWLSLAATLGFAVFILITFRLPILAAAKSIWPFFDVI